LNYFRPAVRFMDFPLIARYNRGGKRRMDGASRAEATDDLHGVRASLAAPLFTRQVLSWGEFGSRVGSAYVPDVLRSERRQVRALHTQAAPVVAAAVREGVMSAPIDDALTTYAELRAAVAAEREACAAVAEEYGRAPGWAPKYFIQAIVSASDGIARKIRARK
jgi:hypothetical protein